VTIALDYVQSPPVHGFHIVGDRGRIDCDLIANVVTISGRDYAEVEYHDYHAFRRNDMFLEELRNFLSFVEGMDEPAVDLRGAMESLSVALAARNSMERGAVIPIGLG
jgi:hypothetical protein